ncbi:MAG: hypothetical protein R3326_02490 [Gemmatimonadota bacterium]|nr:hypothetical protein [Gemmatimonadota bacterium]
MNLARFQVVHRRPGTVVWRIAPRPGVATESASARLGARSQRVLGEQTVVDVELVDEIPTGPSGKARSVERR